jgi:hypothetical protein
MLRVAAAVALYVALWPVVGQCAPPKGPEGRLVVTSSTEGAQVFVDGELVGQTPLAAPIVRKPGTYTLKIVKRGFTEFIDVVTIKARKETKLDIDLLPIAGVVRITANVKAARVFVDGKFLGETPLETDVALGPKAIKITKGGYRELVKKLDVVAGQTINLDVTLEELPVGSNPFRPAPARATRWYEKWWLWAIVAGGATALALSIALPSYYLTRDPIATFNPRFCWGAGVQCR